MFDRPPVFWMLFFHILAAFWLAAGSFAGAVVRAHTKRQTELRDKVNGLRLASRLVNVFAIPGSLVAGVLGFGLVTLAGHSFDDGWVQASIGIYLAMLVVSFAYLGPRLRRTLRAADESLAAGKPTPELQQLAAAKLPGILADVLALGIVVLTFLMVFRPKG